MTASPAKKVTDEVLIYRFQNGDLSAFEEIVRRYQGQLINFVGRLLGDRITAEDIVQETFLRVYRNKHRYKEIAKFSTWIYTIAGNLARTEPRRRKIRNFFSISQRGDGEKDYEIPDQAIDVEKQAEASVIKELIMKEITKLRWKHDCDESKEMNDAEKVMKKRHLEEMIDLEAHAIQTPKAKIKDRELSDEEQAKKGSFGLLKGTEFINRFLQPKAGKKNN